MALPASNNATLQRAPENTAAVAGLRGMKTKIVESLPEPGGQLAVLYPEKLIYDVPGCPKIFANG